MIKFKKIIRAVDLFFERNMQSLWYATSALALASAILSGDKLNLVYSGITYLIARSYEE